MKNALFFVSVICASCCDGSCQGNEKKKKWVTRAGLLYGFLHISRLSYITRSESYLMARIKSCVDIVCHWHSFLFEQEECHVPFFEKALFSSRATDTTCGQRKPSRSRISLWWKDGCLVHTLLLKYLHVMTAAHHSIQKSVPPLLLLFKKILFLVVHKKMKLFLHEWPDSFFLRAWMLRVSRSNTSPLLSFQKTANLVLLRI